jgi:hypothetical protein
VRNEEEGRTNHPFWLMIVAIRDGPTGGVTMFAEHRSHVESCCAHQPRNCPLRISNPSFNNSSWMRCAPEWIREGHLPNQSSDIRSDLGGSFPEIRLRRNFRIERCRQIRPNC